MTEKENGRRGGGEEGRRGGGEDVKLCTSLLTCCQNKLECFTMGNIFKMVQKMQNLCDGPPLNLGNDKEG
jgi:hypothetical protein